MVSMHTPDAETGQQYGASKKEKEDKTEKFEIMRKRQHGYNTHATRRSRPRRTSLPRKQALLTTFMCPLQIQPDQRAVSSNVHFQSVRHSGRKTGRIHIKESQDRMNTKQYRTLTKYRRWTASTQREGAQTT